MEDDTLAPSISAYVALKCLVFSLFMEQANNSGDAGAFAENVFHNAMKLADLSDGGVVDAEEVNQRLIEYAEALKGFHHGN
tara:strand:+ start:600 stop:842 length:243 start_codon:yes stop_codon:yes gene_type:complete